MSGSTAPTVLTALYNVGNALTGVTCVLGMGVTDQDLGQTLYIGLQDPYADQPLGDALTGAWDWPYATTTQRDEKYTVYCCAVAWSGDDDPTACIANVFAIFTTYTTLLKADTSLAGIELQVEGGDFGLRLGANSNGVRAVMPFTFLVHGRPTN